MVERLSPADIVASIHEGLVVLGADLRVEFANHAFYRMFDTSEDKALGHKLIEDGNGLWAIPELGLVLQDVLRQASNVERFEIEHEFPSLGQRVMRISARSIVQQTGGAQRVLLIIEDITERARLNAEREAALAESRTLLEEINHRVKNSLAMISGIISMEARNLKDPQSRDAFERVRSRIAAVGNLYSSLSRSRAVATIDVKSYITSVAEDVVGSAAGRAQSGVALTCDIPSELISTQIAVPLGIIVNEAITNCLKYAFPASAANPAIEISLRADGGSRILSIADNGQGFDSQINSDSGVGHRLMEAFATQLGGELSRLSNPDGTLVRLTIPEARFTGATLPPT